jgi:pimeloyl-ACP methyl ester carboxylesterase
LANKEKTVGTLMKKKIFILHGWAYSTEKWKPFIELLKDKNFDPVLLKIPGLTTELTEVWTLDDYVAWLKDVLVHEKEKVILLGHSNGGRISLAFSLKYPEKVAKIVLLDSAGIYHNELQLRVKRLFFGTVAKIGKNIREVKTVREIFYRFVRERDYEKANPLLRQTMKNLINSDLTPVLHQISIPTIIIWGGSDKITPVKDGELMHKEIKQSTLHIIKDARHSPQFTHVQEVVEIIYANL